MKKVRENPRIYFLLSLNSTIDICLPVLYTPPQNNCLYVVVTTSVVQRASTTTEVVTTVP